MTECNAALGEIVRGKLQRDPIAGQHADSIAPETPGQMREHYAILFELYAEKATGKFF